MHVELWNKYYCVAKLLERFAAEAVAAACMIDVFMEVSLAKYNYSSLTSTDRQSPMT